MIQRFLKLAGRDCHIFKGAEHIRKLEPDKLHILVPYQFHNIFFRILSFHIPRSFPFISCSERQNFFGVHHAVSYMVKALLNRRTFYPPI